MSHKTPHHASPRGKIDAAPPSHIAGRQTPKPLKSERGTSTGRRPLSPQNRRLIANLRISLAKAGISHSKAGELADIDPGDARRVLAFGEATPRTLRKLFEKFKVNEYKNLSRRDRFEALLLEIHAAAERQAQLLGELAHLSAGDDPPF